MRKKVPADIWVYRVIAWGALLLCVAVSIHNCLRSGAEKPHHTEVPAMVRKNIRLADSLQHIIDSMLVQRRSYDSIQVRIQHHWHTRIDSVFYMPYSTTWQGVKSIAAELGTQCSTDTCWQRAVAAHLLRGAMATEQYTTCSIQLLHSDTVITLQHQQVLAYKATTDTLLHTTTTLLQKNNTLARRVRRWRIATAAALVLGIIL